MPHVPDDMPNPANTLHTDATTAGRPVAVRNQTSPSSSASSTSTQEATVAARIVRGWAFAYRTVFAALSVSIYLAAAPFGYAAFALMQLRREDPQRRARRLHNVLHRAFRLMHTWIDILRLMRLSAHGNSPRTLPDGPCVVVANHPTLVDVTAIIAVFGGMCTVVKPRLFRAWWLRSLMCGAQHIEGATTAVDAARIVEAAVSRLEHGHRVLIFPEGTRSPEGGISAFGRTAFEIACRANVALVPIWMRCEPPFLTKTTPMYRLPHPTAVLDVTALPPLMPADFDNDSRALQRAVQQLYRDRCSSEQSCSSTV